MVDITAESTSSPRPFVEVLGLWLKIFKMDEAFVATGPGIYGIFHNVMQFQGIGTPAP